MNYDYVFLGSKRAGLDLFLAAHSVSASGKWLVICPEDSHDTRSVKAEFEEVCQNLAIDIGFARSRSAFEELIKPATAALVCGWYWILRPEVLQLFKNGMWGVHHSLLPKYRGGSPLVWALIAGEPQVGSTLFRLEEGVDSGEIAAQVDTAVESGDDIGSVLERLNLLMTDQVLDKWPQIVLNDFRGKIQNDSDASKYPKRTDEDGLIDWGTNATQIKNFVRAQTTPYPGAYSFLNGVKARILACEVAPEVNSGEPGRLSLQPDDTILVVCGQATAIRVKKRDLRLDYGGTPQMDSSSAFVSNM